MPSRSMRSTHVRLTHVAYAAAGWGVGELWLDGDRVLHSDLPRPATAGRLTPEHALAGRLGAFFSGADDDFADVELDLGDDPFYVDCARALRAVPRGEVVSYGELAVLAGRPRAARAAGTFCACCNLSPFVPTHRVVAASGIGSYGSLGVAYKRRLLELEGFAL